MITAPSTSTTEAMNKINKVMTKVKYTAFGKVKMNKNASHKRVDENNETLLRQQRMDV